MSWPPVIIEDTRNQIGRHKNINDWCTDNGIRVIRSKLLVGDYALPTSQEFCVDTKYGMQEVYSNLVLEHDRFARECDLAKELGINLVILVEEEEIRKVSDVHKWRNPRYERYEHLKRGHEHGYYTGTQLPKRKPVSSDRLERMMFAFAEHHGCEWMFCRKKDAGPALMGVLTGEALR